MHTWWEVTLKLRQFLEFNGVFSINNLSTSPGSSHLTLEREELSAQIFPSDPVSDLSDYGLISGALE